MDQPSKPLPTDTVVLNKISFSHQDIFNVVDSFYFQIQQDPTLSIPFASVHDWPEHVDRLTHFWWIRFGGKPYLFSEYNPVPKHFFAGFNVELLTRWLEIFHHVLKEKLTDQQAHIWANIAVKMGQVLTTKNEFFRLAQEESENES